MERLQSEPGLARCVLRVSKTFAEPVVHPPNLEPKLLGFELGTHRSWEPANAYQRARGAGAGVTLSAKRCRQFVAAGGGPTKSIFEIEPRLGPELLPFAMISAGLPVRSSGKYTTVRGPASTVSLMVIESGSAPA